MRRFSPWFVTVGGFALSFSSSQQWIVSYPYGIRPGTLAVIPLLIFGFATIAIGVTLFLRSARGFVLPVLWVVAIANLITLVKVHSAVVNFAVQDVFGGPVRSSFGFYLALVGVAATMFGAIITQLWLHQYMKGRA